MRRLLFVGVLAGVLVGCGEPPESGGPVSAPSTLLPDGTVPWVDEPASEDEFSLRPQRREDPNAKPCTAGDLRGEFTSWQQSGRAAEAEGLPQREHPHLFGYARVTNISQRICRLRGEVPTRLRDSAGELTINYTHSISDEAKRQATIVPPGESAELRLDWSAPFCQPVGGQLELEISLPEDGGRLRVPVTTATVPPCTGQIESRPEATSWLSSGGFDEPARQPGPESPMIALKATVEPPALAARPGELAMFHVRLANPTERPIALDPCPGYLLERFSMGSVTTPAVNDDAVYRLNCRPVQQIPAQGEVRFEMRVRVPSELTTGRELIVTWRLIGPDLLGAPAAWDQFTITIP